MLEASVVDGQPAIVTTPSPSSTIEGMGAGNDRVWILYDVENATSVYSVCVCVCVCIIVVQYF